MNYEIELDKKNEEIIKLMNKIQEQEKSMEN